MLMIMLRTMTIYTIMMTMLMVLLSLAADTIENAIQKIYRQTYTETIAKSPTNGLFDYGFPRFDLFSAFSGKVLQKKREFTSSL